MTVIGNADDTVEQARAQALTYALALMRDRLKLEAPLNAARIQRHIDVLLAWVATAPTPSMADDTLTARVAVDDAIQALCEVYADDTKTDAQFTRAIGRKDDALDALIAAVRAEQEPVVDGVAGVSRPAVYVAERTPSTLEPPPRFMREILLEQANTRLEAERDRLKGKLDAAEQHVKILQAQRAEREPDAHTKRVMAEVDAAINQEFS